MAVTLLDLQLIYGVAGARQKFEKLVKLLLKRENDGAKGFEAVRGDDGIDVYVGDLTSGEGVHVFQCKFFPQGLGPTQKGQVRKSCRRVRPLRAVDLGDGWNAEPNAPDPVVQVLDGEVVLTFSANPFQYPRYAEDQRLRLRFKGARKYRLGSTNDEGWYKGQCRFSGEAPEWGEFYEVSGDLKLDRCPKDWHIVGVGSPSGRHFLFYLRDQTFECEADDWALEE